MIDWKFIVNKHLRHVKTAGGFAWDYESFMGPDHEKELEPLLLLGGSETCFIDVGAYVGRWSVPAARIYRHVYAFEPDSAYKILQRNIKLNHLNNVTVHNVALSEWDGSSTVSKIGHHVHLTPGLENGETKVKVRRLDSFDWIPPPSMVKIDVEGDELQVLKGGLKTISEFKPHLCIELHDWTHGEQGALQQLLSGYYWLKVNRHIFGQYGRDFERGFWTWR